MIRRYDPLLLRPRKSLNQPICAPFKSDYRLARLFYLNRRATIRPFNALAYSNLIELFASSRSHS